MKSEPESRIEKGVDVKVSVLQNCQDAGMIIFGTFSNSSRNVLQILNILILLNDKI